MKILYISELMTGRDSGAKVSTWLHANLLSEITELDVVCLYPHKDKKNIDKYKFQKKFKKTYFIESYRNKIEEGLNIFTLNGWCMNARVRNCIVSIIKKNDYDCIFIDDSVLGKLVRTIKKKFPHVKIISYYHDVKAELSLQWIKASGIKVIPFNIGIMLNERINSKYADVNLVLNKREGDLFKKHYKKKPDAFLPVSVPDMMQEKIRNKTKRDNKKCRLLFVGAYYYPNIIGISWFINNVMRKIDEAKFELVIIGSEMEKLMIEGGSSNIIIKGWVEDLAYEYMMSDIVVEPLFDGGGMKIKTAEALQFGKPIVGTKESFEGYYEFFTDEVKGKYIFICDSENEFIQAIKYIENNKMSSEIVYPVRDIYLNYFSTESNKKVLQKIIQGLCN